MRGVEAMVALNRVAGGPGDPGPVACKCVGAGVDAEEGGGCGGRDASVCTEGEG